MPASIVEGGAADLDPGCRLPTRPRIRRTASELAAFLRRRRLSPASDYLARLPRGDGHTVFVLPPIVCGDPITIYGRRVLTALGYRVEGWELGVNLGPTRRVKDRLLSRFETLVARDGPVSIVGFSMGGLFARWLALEQPGSVRRVITVCSPFNQPLDSMFMPLTPFLPAWPEARQLGRRVADPLPVPGTFVFSRADGIVAWESCCDSRIGSDNVEIAGPHVTITHDPEVLEIVASRLAR